MTSQTLSFVRLPLIAAALLFAGAAHGQSGAPPVTVAKPVVKEIVEWDEYTGRFEAVDSVEIQAQVSGYLQSIHVEDGQTVDKGDLLFVIDPRPFEAAVARAKATLERAKSQLTLAQLDLQRAERLLPKGAITGEEVDTRRANKRVAEADVAAARAELRTAELDLEFTRVTAPVSGRLSSARVDIGNLVVGGAGAATTLTTIVSLDPVHFVFDASESEYLKYVRLHGTGSRPTARNPSRPVYVRLLDETEWTRSGRIDFVDNAFDEATGTIRARATFANPDGILLPGVFGRLRLAATEPYEALMVPDTAILSDQSAKIIMVVGDDGVVAARPVEPGPVQDGLRAIRSGLGPDDRVIVKGLLRARPGATVSAEETSLADGGAGASAKP